MLIAKETGFPFMFKMLFLKMSVSLLAATGFRESAMPDNFVVFNESAICKESFLVVEESEDCAYNVAESHKTHIPKKKICFTKKYLLQK